MLDIMGKRYYYFAASLLLILAGVVGYFINGFTYDIQFEGGTLIELQMKDENFEPSDAVAIVSQTLNKVATAQKLKNVDTKNAGNNIDILMLKVSKSDTLTDEELNKVIDALKTNMNVAENPQMNVQNVQPFIGKELLNKGLLASFLSFIAMMLYVWWRYSTISGLPAAVIAILALLHDTLIMLTVYVLFKIPLNESFIAAILTILGYSMNDTIIIYDRIRENSRLMKKADKSQLVNKSIMQTIARSINTTVTTVISIVTVYIFAVINDIGSIKEFSFPLIIGLVSGSYSSIFIAGPLWAMWEGKKQGKRTALKPAKS